MDLKIFRFILFVMMLIGFSSCLGDDDSTTSTSLKDAQIYAFSLSNDDISELSSVTFTIDHINGLIYNSDSMTYGTVVSKVLSSITANSSRILVMAKATNDTVSWSSSDSIDFSQPVKLEVYSYDGTEKKVYTATLNIHQQDGDGFTWTQLTDKATNKQILSQKTLVFNNVYYSYLNTPEGILLYISLNSGITWLPQTMTTFPANTGLMNILTFKGVLYGLTNEGVIYKSEDGRRWEQFRASQNNETIVAFIGVNNDSECYALVKKDENYYHVTSSDMNNWISANEPILANFPVEGFSVACNSFGLIAVGGKNMQGELLNTTWLTSDGLTWIQTADAINNALTAREGASLVYYADRYCLIGGKTVSGFNDDMFVSVTNGVTWIKANELSVSDFYTPRAYASALTEGNYIRLFGGTNGSVWLDDVWSGYLNEVKFE